MAKSTRNSFVFNVAWRDILITYSDEVRLKMYDAIIEYASTGIVPKLPEALRLGFEFIKNEIDRNNDKYEHKCEVNRANGRRGGNPNFGKGRPNPYYKQGISEDNPEISEDKPIYDNDSDIENDNDNDNDNDKKYHYRDIAEAWNKIVVSLPGINSITPARQRHLKARLREAKVPADKATAFLTDLFKRVQASDFLTGRTGNWDGCSFDWVIKAGNWQKITEGNYDNRREQRPANTTRTGKTLGEGEYITADGRRTFGNGSITVPDNAPARPSSKHCWVPATNSWALL